MYEHVDEQNLPIKYPELIVQKSTGLTAAEAELSSLGHQTFLDLWSYPNPYKKQKNGQELCDLLVVFEDTIIIFSDKNCKYGEHEDPRVNWRRWYRNAIKASCNQLIGAKRWITEHPDMITLDAKNQQTFPFRIQVTERTKFHMIAVAHGATDACIKYYEGGDGELVLNTSLTEQQCTGQNCEPFEIGLNSHDAGTFIHIFDDPSYQIILQELDTIQDFIDYLDARKKLLLSKTVHTCNEADLLALHLSGHIHGNEEVLIENSKNENDEIIIEQGLYNSLTQQENYKKWRHQLIISYFWDDLLQRTFHYIMSGQSQFTTHKTIEGQNKIFHWMASEKRYYRLLYSKGIIALMEKAENNKCYCRIITSLTYSDLCYLIILMPHHKNIPENIYRESRLTHLANYCYITKHRFPQFNHIIAIAHETEDKAYSSEDFIYLDATQWEEADQQRAEEIIKNMSGII